MRNKLILSFITGLLFVVAWGGVAAQDDAMRIIPVEMFVCNYNDGKGPGDLDKATAKWNKWADKQGTDDYAAWTLTPYYFGEEQDFDVLWLGAAKDAVALGEEQDSYMAEKAGLHDAFNDALTCSAHVNYASVNYKAAPNGATPADSILTFSDCKYEEGTTFPAMSAAMAEWSQYLTDKGSTSTIFHWYPVYGGGKQDFDFKRIQVYENLAALGANYEIVGNGGGYVTYGKLMDHLVSCDASRAYVAKNRRFVKLR